MNSKIKYILLIFVTLAYTVMQAQQTLSIEDCRKQAIDYNKTLKKTGLKIKEAQANRKAAKTAYLPSIAAQATAMHRFDGFNIEMPGGFLPTATSEANAMAGKFSGMSNVYSPAVNIGLDHISLVTGGINAEQAIYMGGKIANMNKQAAAMVQMAQSGYKLKLSEVIELTDKTFWNVAMIEANINLAKTYIKMLTELEEQMTAMYDAGLSPASEKLKVSVQKNEAELQLLVANNGLKIAKMYLNQVIGRDLNSPVNINYDASYKDLFDMSNGITMAKENREELKLKEKQVELNTFQQKIDLSDYLPSLGVSAQYTNIYVNQILENVNFQPMLSAKLSIPICKWGQGKQKQLAAQSRIQQAETELSNVTDMVSLEVMQTKVKVEEAYQAIQIAERNIAQAEESLAETKASFEVGLNTTTDLLNAQADWQKSKANLITAIAHYKVLETSWKRVTGQLYAVQ